MNHGTILLVEDNKNDIGLMIRAIQERGVIATCKPGANSFVREPTSFIEFTEAIEELHVYWLLDEVARPGRAS